jgi:hypothetical protein
MKEVLKTINVTLAFLLELFMLAAFSYWGFQGEKSVLLKWLLGIGLPLGIVLLWGFYLAPNSKQRLKLKAGLALSLALFLGAALALSQAGQAVLAIILASLALLNRGLALLWKQW